MNRDFAEMLSALSEAGAEYIVVGGYAVIAHGHPRATGDIDTWVRPTAENAQKVLSALRHFGAPLADLSDRDLVTPGMIFEIGVVPNRIDILTEIDGVTFGEAWASRITAQVEGRRVPVLGKEAPAAQQEGEWSQEGPSRRQLARGTGRPRLMKIRHRQ